MTTCEFPVCVGVCFTHTAVGPVDVEKGKGEKSLVALLWEQFLFKLDKISFEVNHFWCTAVSPAQKDTSSQQLLQSSH